MKKEEDRGVVWAAGHCPRAGYLGCYGEWESRGRPNVTITNTGFYEDTNHDNYSFIYIFTHLFSPTPMPPLAELEVILSDTNPFSRWPFTSAAAESTEWRQIVGYCTG